MKTFINTLKTKNDLSNSLAVISKILYYYTFHEYLYWVKFVQTLTAKANRKVAIIYFVITFFKIKIAFEGNSLLKIQRKAAENIFL